MSTQALTKDDDILTKQELAEFLEVSERTIERWIVERAIPFIVLPKRGRKCNVRFLKSTIIIWLKKNERRTSTKLNNEVIDDDQKEER
jgi:excisionase family DNA binding protein